MHLDHFHPYRCLSDRDDIRDVMDLELSTHYRALKSKVELTFIGNTRTP